MLGHIRFLALAPHPSLCKDKFLLATGSIVIVLDLLKAIVLYVCDETACGDEVLVAHRRGQILLDRVELRRLAREVVIKETENIGYALRRHTSLRWRSSPSDV